MLHGYVCFTPVTSKGISPLFHWQLYDGKHIFDHGCIQVILFCEQDTTETNIHTYTYKCTWHTFERKTVQMATLLFMFLCLTYICAHLCPVKALTTSYLEITWTIENIDLFLAWLTGPSAYRGLFANNLQITRGISAEHSQFYCRSRQQTFAL